ncbi:MAG TPA: acetyltransferase [Bacteroidales bacterium]|nr:acetyltransferase [Bacteroidales bacterium]
MRKIVVAGGGGHAKVVISVLKKLDYDVIGYTDKSDKGALLGIPYLGTDTILKELRENNEASTAAVGVGHIRSTATRKKLYSELDNLNYDLPAILSPDAIVNDEVTVGKGTFIADGVVVNSGSTIGELSIINTNASIDHDCSIGDFVHIAPGVTLSGGVTIGSDVLIGTGASIIQNISIVEKCIIGAGSVVINDCDDTGIYVGNPARKIK